MTDRILVVDDEPAVTDLLAYNLRKAHYEVMVASDGVEALRLANESSPDLILMDASDLAASRLVKIEKDKRQMEKDPAYARFEEQ